MANAAPINTNYTKGQESSAGYLQINYSEPDQSPVAQLRGYRGFNPYLSQVTLKNHPKQHAFKYSMF